MHRARTAALAALAVLAAPACARTTTGIGAPPAHADPTTTPSSPSSSVFPSEKIDTLLLSLDEVNKGLPPLDHPFVTQDPVRKQPDDLQIAGSTACGTPVTVGTQDAVGNGWSSYRSELYVGEQNTMVELVLAVYPDGPAVERAFERIAEAARACKPNAELAVESSTDGAVRWHSTAGWGAETRHVNNVLVQVKAADTGKDDSVAHAISELVIKKIQER